mmetsp:Transcript_138921/g.245498  ORF Transcript_138921/g.245498 Transcript_138921/m.245498 type:complete len:280 (-) Transcript_138921:152-991(-)
MAIFGHAAFRVVLLVSILSHTVRAADDDEEDTGDEENDGTDLNDKHLEEFHAEADSNGDSEVAHSEFMNVVEEHHQDVMKERVGPLLASRDTLEKDGLISLAEHVKATVPAAEDGEYEKEVALFKAADRNSDGFLNQSELGALQSPQKNSAVMDVVTKESIIRTDFDNDGKLTLKEFDEQHKYVQSGLGSSENVFNELDRDKDGYLDHQELQHLKSGQLEREKLVKNYINNVDKDGDSHLDVKEMLQGRETVSDSGLQDYLIAWANKRNIPKMAPRTVV